MGIQLRKLLDQGLYSEDMPITAPWQEDRAMTVNKLPQERHKNYIEKAVSSELWKIR